MSVFMSLSTLLRLGFWLAVACVVLGVALGGHDTPEVGTTPDTVVVTSTEPPVEAAAGNGN